MGIQGMVELPELPDVERKTELGETEPLLCEPMATSWPAFQASFERKKSDAGELVRRTIFSSGSHSKILVAVCGPKSLMNAVKDSVDECRGSMDARIDFHCEDFGGS